MSNEFTEIPLRNIEPSSTNPRRHFDDAKLDELADSIKEHGVLQPILVRPVNSHYELVAGERRLRAAFRAGLDQIPAVVREMNDQAVLEAQVIENQQRADLHPLEEAEGYHSLMTLHNYSCDDIAAKIGKSKTYIYERMRLAELPEDTKEALWNGKLLPSVGLLIARLGNSKMQSAATTELTDHFKVKRNWDNSEPEPVAFRFAKTTLEQRYMLDLSNAPFLIDDASLLPSAGSCQVCPKRTGNQMGLFTDVPSSDICTDPECYSSKIDAFCSFVEETKKVTGHRMATKAEIKEIMPHKYGGLQLWDTPFVELDKRLSLIHI